MPVHDWTRVSPGTFHDFHNGWTVHLRDALNGGILPDDYYAMTEQVVGEVGPDVLTLQEEEPSQENGTALPGSGGVAVVPQTRFVAEAEMDDYILKRRSIVIRHNSEDRVVALIEILSHGNKSNRHGLRAFLDKVLKALLRGVHLLLVDLYPPTRRDPHGIHGVLWGEISEEPFQLPADKPLTLASYSAGKRKRAYVEPVAVGEKLRPMPLFLKPDFHVSVPLEATYAGAYSGVARRWKRVLEGQSDPASEPEA